MFHLHQSLIYYLYPYPVDMRKSFYTLSGIVSSEMHRDVRSGEVFIFINRQQTIMKILHMEYAGMVIYHKKLESGRFKLPEYDETYRFDDDQMVRFINDRSECKTPIAGKLKRKS